uniref:Uncharacterized protein n=1 Tax=Arundo donax TaxID=35708 RepID=A0A0A9GNS8_ARUDO
MASDLNTRAALMPPFEEDAPFLVCVVSLYPTTRILPSSPSTLSSHQSASTM